MTDREEHGGRERAGHHIAPAETHVRQEAEQEGEQPGRHNERHEHADATPEQRDAGGVPGEPAVQGGKCRRHRERDHQQKADRHHQAERAHTIDQECLEVGTRIGLHAPDRVQRPLKFEECSSGSDDEGDAANDGGENASPSLAGSFEKTLYGARTLASDEVIELSDNFPADGLGAEHHARDSGCDEQYRCDRKQRVVGERRAEAEGVVVPPRPDRRLEHSQDRWRAHAHFTL